MVGIYAIQNIINGKIYIGQSIDIQRRWSQERKIKRLNCYLLSAMKKHGLENFSFYVLEECDKERLNDREKFYIKLYHSLDPEYGYNMTSGGDNCYKRPYQKLSEVHKKKISNANKGYKPTQETIDKIINSRRKSLLEKHRIDIWCLETNEIYSSIEDIVSKLNLDKGQVFRCLRGVCQSTKGYHICYLSDKDKIKWGIKKSGFAISGGGTSLWKDDTRNKISEKAKNRWSNMTDEQKKQISEKLRNANLGKKLSEEHKNKISKSQIGKKRKEGTGKNISLALKKAYRQKVNRFIVCIETGEKFYTFMEAGQTLRKRYPKVNSDGIKRCISGKQNSCGGLHFKIEMINKEKK